MTLYKRLVLLALCLAAGVSSVLCQSVRVEKLRVERLPDLQVPRCNHSTFFTGGELVVIGGHTKGFVPTATAEYFKNGQWHLVETTYEHDQGFALRLKDGRVMVGGGHEQHLGIGSIFAVEFYDPASHASGGYACLDTKRSMAQGVELDSGRVVIAGNWYGGDGLEVYDGNTLLQTVADVSMARSWPYVMRSGSDDVVVFGCFDEHGEPIDSVVVDRMKGEPYSHELFRKWRPMRITDIHPADDSFIGNEEKDDFSYLFAVVDDKGGVAIACVRNGEFGLLPTDGDVPTEWEGHRIRYFSTVIANRSAGRGYIVGNDDDCRLYVLGVDYAKADDLAAPLTLYVSEPQDSIGFGMPVLTEKGNLVIAGGWREDLFKPYSSVLMLCVGGEEDIAEMHKAAFIHKDMILWLLLAVVAVVAAFFLWRWLRRKQLATSSSPDGDKESSQHPTVDLMQLICSTMEKEQLYLNPRLKVSDMAHSLGMSTGQISDVIKVNREQSFSQFVNSYRVAYAQQLMNEHPDMKITRVGESSGFASEMSFFRTFKLFTGMTPGEWSKTKK